MRRVFVWEYLTLDGVMESPEKWQFSYYSDDLAEFIKAQVFAAGALLLGRVTYEAFVAYWPSRTNNEWGIADKFNSMPKFVVSSTLEEAKWNNTTLIRGDAVEEIARLKQQAGGDIGISGSGELVRALMQHNLIDEYWLIVHPVVLGRGKRLFGDGSDKVTLRLVEARTFSSGVVALRYQPDGEKGADQLSARP